MSSKHTSKTLRELTDEELKDEEFQRTLRSALGEEAEVITKVLANSTRIWSAAADEVAQLENAKKALEKGAAALREKVPGEPDRFWAEFPQLSGPGCLGLFGLVFIFYGMAKGFSIAFAFLKQWPVALLLVIFVVAIVMIYRNGIRLQRAYQRKQETTRTEIEKRYDLATNKLIAAQLEGTAIPNQLRKAIRAEIREALKNLGDNHVELKDHSLAGLSEIFSAQYEVSTEAKGKLTQALGALPGGSVGIAGPRGAGKSTLLWAFCHGAKLDCWKHRPLTVLTSAPVVYEARDFILHLFGMLCQATLKTSGDGASANSNFSEEKRIKGIQELMERMLPFIVSLGIILVFCSFILTLFLLTGTRSSVDSKAGNLVVGNALTNAAPPIKTPGNPEAGVVSAADFFKAMDLKPATLLISGLLCLGLAATYKEYATGCFSEYLPSIAEARKKARSEKAAKNREAELNKPDPIEAAARSLLQEIRFQQTFTSGWSGALKMPVGVEATLTGSVALAERQRSLPEIVDKYRTFLRLLTTENKVVIGIDELDKLESREAAERFLNEIKSLFSVEGCYYLISVSEDAMTSFERRGTPFRDTFDSSFNTILHVPYLDFAQAKRLLDLRILGLGTGFCGLCHCLTGGLPRDLLRCCLEMCEIGYKTNTRSLARLAEKLVLDKVERKLSAISFSAAQLDLEPGRSNLLEAARKVGIALGAFDDFRQAMESFMAPDEAQLVSDEESDDDRILRRKLDALRHELHAYLWFARTVADVFARMSTKEDVRRSAVGCVFDRLARCFQSFTLSPTIALNRTEEFRLDFGLGPARKTAKDEPSNAPERLKQPGELAGEPIRYLF